MTSTDRTNRPGRIAPERGEGFDRYRPDATGRCSRFLATVDRNRAMFGADENGGQ
jgi:hypothetical protein